MKIYYTVVNTYLRLNVIDQDERKRYIAEALDKASLTVTSSKIISIFKIILDKASEDGIISQQKKYELDNKAEENVTENSPYIKKLQDAVKRNTSRIEGLEGNAEAINNSLETMRTAIRKERKIKAGIGFISVLLNALSMGAAGTTVQAFLDLSIDEIVDFGDVVHLQQYLPEDTFREVSQDGLGWVEGFIEQRQAKAIEDALKKDPNALVTVIAASAIAIESNTNIERFIVGQEVQLVRLDNATMNGLTGTIENGKVICGRVQVRLNETNECKMIKPNNLEEIKTTRDDNGGTFLAGQAVRLMGLGQDDMNGENGIVKGASPKNNGRIQILLEEGDRLVSVKPQNLELVADVLD